MSIDTYNEIDYYREEEGKAFHAACVAEVAKFFGEPEDVTLERLNRRIYKATDCGAWVNFSMTKPAVQFGCIIEGSDAELQCDWLVWPFEQAHIEAALQWLEDESDVLWKEANL